LNDGLKDKIAFAEKQNDILQKSLESCLANTGQGSMNIAKLLDEIDKSNVYIKKLVDGKFKNDSLNLYISNTLKRSLADIDDRDVDVKVLKGVVFISLSDNLLYKSGSYEVLPSAEKVLAKVAKIINDYTDYDVLVEGHTDNVPYNGSGAIKDNWDLSAMRATSVVKVLQTVFNVEPNRMTAGARSEYNPKTTNDTIKGKSENRRTVIVVMPKLDQFLNLMNNAPPQK
jgi:chemotaxis protein MotB